MKLTNAFGLPEPLVSAIRRDPYDRVGDISISGLIAPPRKRILEKRHDADIVIDASEEVWKLLGSSIHGILERADTRNHLAEERMVAKVHGWTVSGKPDLMDSHGTLSDYKVCAVYAYQAGLKDEWLQQINAYAWLYRLHGFEVKRGQIVAILRDWSALRAGYSTGDSGEIAEKVSEGERGYPATGIGIINVPLWSQEDCQKWIEERVRLHQEAEALPDDMLPLCTAQERWERPTTWAVHKLKITKEGPEAGKRAVRVFETAAEAMAYAANNGNKNGLLEVRKRPGESVRCRSYCKATPWCSQMKEQVKTNEYQERTEGAP